MEIKEIYHFSPHDFDSNGKRTSDGTSFREVLKEFERDFHAQYSNYYASFLFANYSTMLLLSRSCNAKENMIYGMDLIENEFDPYTNHHIEIASTRENIVVYGIDSAFMVPDKNGIHVINEKKRIFPLTLVTDDEFKDGILHLKYIDDDDQDDDLVFEPTEIDKLATIR